MTDEIERAMAEADREGRPAPDNLERDNTTGEIAGPNPNWYEGTRWRFSANERGEYRLSLNAESGPGVSFDLTDEQAARLLYAAQAGDLDNYGNYQLG